MRSVWTVILVLVAAAMCRAQPFQTGFEPPAYVGTQAGIPLTGQDGWTTPGGQAFTAHIYPGNGPGFLPNPTGQTQFIVGRGVAGGQSIAQHAVSFSTADTWSITWDLAVRFSGVAPALNPIGSLQPSDPINSRSFSALATWVNPTSPSVWNAGFIVYDAAGNAAGSPGLFAGPQWQGLQPNRWYRQSISFSLSLNRVLDVSITDLTTNQTTTVAPAGWFLRGGANPALPPPTGVRLLTTGALGNLTGWDNLDVCPFQVTGFSPPQAQEGMLVQIDGCGFGTDPDDLSVSVLQVGSGNAIPMTVVQASDMQIIARMGPVPTGAIPGPVRVVRGVGTRPVLNPALDDVIPESPVQPLVWRQLGDPRRAQSQATFLPIPSVPPDVTWLFGSNVSGQMQLLVSTSPLPGGVLRPNSRLRVIAKLHDGPGVFAADLEATDVRMRIGDDQPRYLADRIADVLVSAFQAGGVNATAVLTPSGTNWLLTLTLRDANSIPVPVQTGILDVCVLQPTLVTPFPIGPVTAFFNAVLTNPGSSARAVVDLSGNDGITISPNIPATIGLASRAIRISLGFPGSSVTTRAWGVLSGVPDQLVGSARIQNSNPSFFDVFADFGDIGSSQVRVEVYYNSVLMTAAVVPLGDVGNIGAAAFGLPQVARCGARPTIGGTTAMLWYQLDRPCLITPTGGSAVQGNQIRLIAIGSPATVQSLQAFDIAAGLDGTDIGTFEVTDSYETGICYANCDGSVGEPVLTIADFGCFLNLFAAGDPNANCDGSVGDPILTVADFGCFLNAFAAGCPP